MASIGPAAVTALLGMLTGRGGIVERVSLLSEGTGPSVPWLSEKDVITRQVAAEVAEKTSRVHYPAVQIYCEKVVNDLREKFRSFSGTADLVIEIRVSHEHMLNFQSDLQIYAETITAILENNRGRWSPALFYTGGYTIHYGPIKRGGLNFLQSATIEITVNGSME